ncbi:MAG: hypothetical protein WCO63_01225 [Bacteroidota bacterium]
MLDFHIQEDLFGHEPAVIVCKLPFAKVIRRPITGPWEVGKESMRVLRLAFDTCVEEYVHKRLNAVRHILRSGQYRYSELTLKTLSRTEDLMKELERSQYLPTRVRFAINAVIPELRHLAPSDEKRKIDYHKRLDAFESILISILDNALVAEAKNNIKTQNSMAPNSTS